MIDTTVHAVHTDWNGSWVVCKGVVVAKCDTRERTGNQKHAALITKALKAYLKKGGKKC